MGRPPRAWRARRREFSSVTRTTWAVVVLVGAGLASLGATDPSLPPSYHEAELGVEGLTCGFWCPIQLDHALTTVPGVHGSVVDVARGRVRVAYDPAQVDADGLAARVDGLEAYGCGPPAVVRAVVAWRGARWSAAASVAEVGSRCLVTLAYAGEVSTDDEVHVSVRIGAVDASEEATWRPGRDPSLMLMLPWAKPPAVVGDEAPVRVELRADGAADPCVLEPPVSALRE